MTESVCCCDGENRLLNIGCAVSKRPKPAWNFSKPLGLYPPVVVTVGYTPLTPVANKPSCCCG